MRKAHDLPSEVGSQEGNTKTNEATLHLRNASSCVHHPFKIRAKSRSQDPKSATQELKRPHANPNPKSGNTRT